MNDDVVLSEEVRKDLDIGSAFWDFNQNGNALKSRLIRMGVPLLDAQDDTKFGLKIALMRYKKQKKHKKAYDIEPQQTISMIDYDKINFSELSYSEIEDLPDNTGSADPKSVSLKVKTRWLTDAGMKKRERLINMCQWTFIPIFIEHIRQTTDPADQKFAYVMQVLQEPAPTVQRDMRKPIGPNLVYIETTMDGSIICRRSYPDTSQYGLPYKFAFPKRYIAKINRCLLDNFWQDLRSVRDPNCFAWHKTDEGSAQYLADRGQDIDSSYRDRLLELLHSQAGDVAAVLLSYVCFSVLKDFFPQYRVLNTNTPYLVAKKYLRTQFALNLRSEDYDSAECLAAFFCKPFQKAAWPKTTTAGVQVQSSRKRSKYPTLSVREFESKILQPAGVLWLNRDPAEELAREGQVITLQVPSYIKNNSSVSIGMDLVCDLTKVAHDMTVSYTEDCQKACWQSSRPIILETLNAVYRYAQKCKYPIEGVYSECREDVDSKKPPLVVGILDFARSLEQRIYIDIEDYQMEAVRELPGIDAFKAVVKSQFSACRRKIKKEIQKFEYYYFSLGLDYEDTLKKMRCDAEPYQTNQQMVKNVAFLSTAVHFYLKTCIPQDEQTAACRCVDRALAKLYQGSSRLSAQKMMEDYILVLIRSNRCARVRGERSGEEVKVWYDPKESVFWLPQDSYYKDMLEVLKLPASTPTRRTFEMELEQDGILIPQKQDQSGNPRRTWQRVLTHGGSRQPVLKIFFQDFFKRHSRDPKICKAHDSILGDTSPLRKRQP